MSKLIQNSKFLALAGATIFISTHSFALENKSNATEKKAVTSSNNLFAQKPLMPIHRKSELAVFPFDNGAPENYPAKSQSIKKEYKPRQIPSTLYRYVGVSFGYGVLSNNDRPLSIILDDKNAILPTEWRIALDNDVVKNSLIDNSTNNITSEGGFSARFYGGYEFAFGKSFTVGPELGVSLYPETVNNDTSAIDYPNVPGPIPEGTAVSYSGRASVKGYGGDVLLKVAYELRKGLILNVRPGVQVAHEETKLRYTFSAFDDSVVAFTDSTSISSTRVVPEVIVGALVRPLADYPVYFDLSYQVVFGHNSTDLSKKTSTRKYVSLGLVSYLDI